jgi:hypothetical protein
MVRNLNFVASSICVYMYIHAIFGCMNIFINFKVGVFQGNIDNLGEMIISCTSTFILMLI